MQKRHQLSEPDVSPLVKTCPVCRAENIKLRTKFWRISYFRGKRRKTSPCGSRGKFKYNQDVSFHRRQGEYFKWEIKGGTVKMLPGDKERTSRVLASLLPLWPTPSLWSCNTCPQNIPYTNECERGEKE